MRTKLHKLCKVITLCLILSILSTINVHAYGQTAAATNDYTTWKQTSKTWGEATPWPNASIPKFGDAGCWITSVAILLRHYNVVTDSNVNTFNPLICNNRLMDYGIVNSAGDFVYGNLSKMNSAYPGFEYVGEKAYSFSNLKSLYDQGYACIVHETRGHYVAVRSVSDSKVTVMDPGYNTTELTNSDSIMYFKVKSNSSGGTAITTKPTITSDASVYKTGSDVVLKRNNVANTNFYQLIVWYKGEQILSTKMTNNTYTLNDLKAGRYEVYLQVGNSVSGTTTSSPYVFDVQTPITTKPTITSDASVYETGSDVVLKRNNVANTNFYQLIVYRSDKQILSTKMNDTTYTLTNLPAAKYRIYLQVGNAITGTVTSEEYVFHVQNVITTKPTITSDKTVYKTGNDVILKRNTVSSTNFYQLIVYYNDKQILSTKMPENSYTLKSLKTGKYRVYLQVGNAISGTKTSEAYYFNVGECKHTYVKISSNKATTSKNGAINYKCSECGVKKVTTIYKPSKVTLSTTTYTYNGKAKKPTVKGVTDSKGKTISASNYTVSYASGRKNVGTYKVTVKFKGNYSGSLTKTFKINPKATSISKLSKAKKAFTVKWKKQSKQVTGYQIQYSTNKKFTNAKTATINKYKTTSKKITKLSAKKTYYVRVRTYKTVGSIKYYSGWSSVKSVKTK